MCKDVCAYYAFRIQYQCKDYTGVTCMYQFELLVATMKCFYNALCF